MIRIPRFAVLFLFASTASAIDLSDPRLTRMLPEAAATPTAAKTVAVDCTKGESVQAAIDKNAGPVTVDIHGICSENVRISHHDDVTLRGADPLTDGIRGVASTPAAPALAVRHSDRVRIESLSISDGPSVGVHVVYSRPTELLNCRLQNNAGTALAATTSLVQGTELTIAQNQTTGIQSLQDAFLSCLGCRIENNAGFAAWANWGGALTLWDSVVIGRRGLVATNGGSYADIDCFSQVSAYPCSLNVTGIAARAIGDATAALYVAGDFTGQVSAFDRGEVALLGARQLASGQPGFGPTINQVDLSGVITVESELDENGVPQPSRVKSTIVSRFGRAVVSGTSTLDGSIQCNSAGDAWLDGSVVATPGSTVSGCEHAAVP